MISDTVTLETKSAQAPTGPSKTGPTSVAAAGSAPRRHCSPEKGGEAVDLMSISEMCAGFGVTPRTLRFYEAKELLFPRRDGQKRLFTRRDRGRLKLILRGKRFGFSLEEIRQLLDLYDRGDAQETQLTRTYQSARERLAQMERQRAELEEAIAELKSQLEWGAEVIASFRRPAAE